MLAEQNHWEVYDIYPMNEICLLMSCHTFFGLNNKYYIFEK